MGHARDRPDASENLTMKKLLAVSLIAATALGLAACSKPAADNAAVADNASVEVANADLEAPLANDAVDNAELPADNAANAN